MSSRSAPPRQVPIDGTINFSAFGGSTGNELDTVNNIVNAPVDITTSGDLDVITTTSFNLMFTYDEAAADGDFSSPLWVIDNFTFVATGADIVDSLNPVTGGEELSITNGTGTLSHASYDDTNVLWEFGITEAGGFFFLLNATAGTDGGAGAGAPMPEPSAALLFLVGLSTVGCRVRRRR